MFIFGNQKECFRPDMVFFIKNKKLSAFLHQFLSKILIFPLKIIRLNCSYAL